MKKNIQYIAKILLAVVVIFTALSILQGVESFLCASYAATSFYAIVSMVSVAKGESQDRAGKSTKYRIHVLHVDTEVDSDNVPLPDKAAQTLADIPRIAGEYWHYIDGLVESVIPKFKTDDDGLVSDNEVEIKLGGLSANTRFFLNNFKGEYFFLVWEVCFGSDAGAKYIGGTRCSGMKMTISEGGWLATNTGATIVFKNSCPDIPYKYLGNTTTSTAEAIAAGATTKALVAGQNEYQFSANVGAINFTAFTGMAAADHGRILTLLGAATSTNASTIDTDDSFILKDGTTYTALPGTQLTVQIFKDGASSYKFVEISRV
jgi:hypothetical protein